MTTQPADEQRPLRAVHDDRPGLADVAAEQYVLGAMMLSADVADTILDAGIRSSDFYRPVHALVYAAVLGALARNEPADPVGLSHALIASGDLERVGGVPYLHTLVSAVPTAANGPYYARIVHELAVRRDLLTTSIRIDQIARDMQRDLPDVVDLVQQTVHAATDVNAQSAMQSLGELADPTLDEILAPDGPDRGISTGLGSLDDLIGGMKPGQLIIVAGRPSVGKSVAVVDFARSAAIHRRIPTAVFSLEMTKSEVVKRLYSAECSVNLTRILHGGLSEFERSQLNAGAPRIRNAPLFIDDSAPMSISAIRSASRRLRQRQALGLIVVDYVQLVRSAAARESRVQEVTEVSNGLKSLAKELGVPVVVACQLNRNSESRSDRRPALSDLRESGSLEQDADIAILLHRPDYQDPEHERAGEIDLIVAKNRHGATDTVTCAAQLDKARIVDFETRNM